MIARRSTPKPPAGQTQQRKNKCTDNASGKRCPRSISCRLTLRRRSQATSPISLVQAVLRTIVLILLLGSQLQRTTTATGQPEVVRKANRFSFFNHLSGDDDQLQLQSPRLYGSITAWDPRDTASHLIRKRRSSSNDGSSIGDSYGDERRHQEHQVSEQLLPGTGSQVERERERGSACSV